MFENNLKIKLGLLITIIFLAISFFTINIYLINQFRKQLNKHVETIVSVYSDELNNDIVNSEYLLKTLLPLINKLDIPIIITTKQSDGRLNYEYINLSMT